MIHPLACPCSDLTADAAEFRDPVFRQALIAAVAMVAHADGAPSPAERSSFLSLLEEDPALATFDRGTVLDELAAHGETYRLDADVGTRTAREKLVRVAGHPRLCAALVRICRAVIPADGVIHPAEHRALAEIRSVLGVAARPAMFGARGVSVPVMDASAPDMAG